MNKFDAPSAEQSAARAIGIAGRSLVARLHSADTIDVRRFSVTERMSTLFEITLEVVSPNPRIDFDAVLGHAAQFQVREGLSSSQRSWLGVCNHIEQTGVEEGGLSTYELTIVPFLWFLTQRRNHRMFQQVSELAIVGQILKEWGITPELRISGTYKTRKYRVQYAESDFAFVSRMLEDVGVSFHFEEIEGETRLVLSDTPQSRARREPTLLFRDNPTHADLEHVTKVRVAQRVRPGRYTLRDHDPRLAPNYALLASANATNNAIESRLERFHYTPGAFLFGTDQGPSTPSADDRGKTRSDEREGRAIAEKRLAAKRSNAKVCSFETTAPDLAPGVVIAIEDHPRSELGDAGALLIVASSQGGESNGVWTHHCEARAASLSYHPPLVTPKPKVSGVESATVVGSAGDEIHTDEFGRVRAHFHWDRESVMNEKSSCWIPVSQGWGGAGYGGSNLPRVGQEVIVDFLGGDPDRPVIIGRLYTNLQKTPYILPDNKTQSGWKSCSTNQTGGYNEIMFEDASGRELLRMQAEKDLHKLVKHDEEVTIGRDRTKLVKRDDFHTVGNDRTKLVEHDEDVTIGNDRTKLVKRDDNLSVGNDRTKLIQMNSRESVGNNRMRNVGVNETVSIGAEHTLNVGASQKIDIGASHSTNVGASHSTSVGGAHSLSVGLASAETIAIAKALTVGGAYAVTVGAAYETTVGAVMNTKVMMTQSEEVGITKTVTVGKKLEMICGKTKVVMDAAGKITWSVDGGGSIIIDNKDINIVAGGGGTVKIIGGLVDVNPQ